MAARLLVPRSKGHWNPRALEQACLATPSSDLDASGEEHHYQITNMTRPESKMTAIVDPGLKSQDDTDQTWSQAPALRRDCNPQCDDWACLNCQKIGSKTSKVFGVSDHELPTCLRSSTPGYVGVCDAGRGGPVLGSQLASILGRIHNNLCEFPRSASGRDL